MLLEAGKSATTSLLISPERPPRIASIVYPIMRIAKKCLLLALILGIVGTAYSRLP